MCALMTDNEDHAYLILAMDTLQSTTQTSTKIDSAATPEKDIRIMFGNFGNLAGGDGVCQI